MKTAVMYGAGNIGRGFIGQVLHDSGFEVVFIDVNTEVVDALNSRRAYTQLIVSRDGVREVNIDNVRAVNGNDVEAVAAELASCELAATAIGANILKFIAPNIAAGIKKRAAQGGKPLNIIICENLMNAADYLRALLDPCFAENEKGLLAATGLVEAVIGRMVPALTPELRAGDPTRIAVEPFCELPINKAGIKGDLPPLEYTFAFSPFAFYEERKLYIHNMGHAVTAYLGYLKGYEYIYEAVADPEIRADAERSMLASARALAAHYAMPLEPLEANVRDLLYRFSNRALADPVVRVAQDPMRKLKPDDRLIGALARCRGEGVPYDGILKAVAAALKFDYAQDRSVPQLKERLEKEGAEGFLRDYCEMNAADAARCLEFYRAF